MKIQGFYFCACGKMHAFCPGFTVVVCSCGRAINQLAIKG